MPEPCETFEGGAPPVRKLLHQINDGKWWKISKDEIAQTGTADFRAAASYHSRKMGTKAEVRVQGDGFMVRLTPR